jgi:hypothetical protein
MDLGSVAARCLGLFVLAAALGDCDMKGAEFGAPMARFALGTRVYVLVEIAGWEWTRYDLLEDGERGIVSILEGSALR